MNERQWDDIGCLVKAVVVVLLLLAVYGCRDHDRDTLKQQCTVTHGQWVDNGTLNGYFCIPPKEER